MAEETESWKEKRNRLLREALAGFSRDAVDDMMRVLVTVEASMSPIKEADEDWQAYYGLLGESNEFAGGPWLKIDVRKLKGGSSRFITESPRAMPNSIARNYLLSRARCAMQLLDQAEDAQVYDASDSAADPATSMILQILRQADGSLIEFGHYAGVGPLAEGYKARTAAGTEING